MNGTVNEGDSFDVEASFFDTADAVALPSTIRYQVYCKTNKQVVRDWTNVAIGTSVTINIKPADNAIINSRNSYELRQLVVQTNANTDTKKSEVLEWRVKNLGGVVS